MERNLSNHQIAKELDLNKDDVYQMTRQLRPGLVLKKPSPTLTGEVECDEVYIITGYKGKPDEVAKKGVAAGAGGSRASAGEGHLQPRNLRSSAWFNAVERWSFACRKTSNNGPSSRSSKRRWPRARVCTRMNTTSTAVWHRGAMRMRVCVIAVGNRHEMMTAIAFTKCT
jgi:hypothetical protein